MLIVLATALASPLTDALDDYVEDPTALVQQVADRGAELERDLAVYGKTEGLAKRLEVEVLGNLAAKPVEADRKRLPLTESEIARTVIDFEAFRLRATITSGVTPKRYFGYFDERWDTAGWERRLRETTKATTAVLREQCTERGHGWTITEAEVAVTFIAEGGALWLGRESERLGKGFHPVFDVGLDDIAKGLEDERDLIADLDKRAGTDLESLVGWASPGTNVPTPSGIDPSMVGLMGERPDGSLPYLKRAMTFEEAVVATGLMVLWEKEIAQTQAARHGVDLARLDPDRQWVAMSLVYNSGIVHLPKRWDAITAFDTASWLHGAMRSSSKRRWPIDLLPASERLASLRSGDPYPRQPTAWLAGYHILQRYGAYVALRDLGGVFDADGGFIPHHVPAAGLTEPSPLP